MTLELRPFQEDAVRELLGYVRQARDAYRAANVRSAIGLTATTGAGKTVIASALIEALLFGSERFGVDPDPKAAFLWMTDLPELNRQTQDKLVTAASRLRYELLPTIGTTFNEEALLPGRVYFINTQLLSRAGLLTREGPTLQRDFTFWDVVRRTIEDPDGRGVTLYLVVDEAHRGMIEGREATEANSIIQRFIKGYPEQQLPPAPVVLGISATPQRFLDLVERTGRATFQHDVPPEEVRQSGLIKERTRAAFAGEAQTDAMALFPEAVRAWRDSTTAWAAYHAAFGAGQDPLVVPALIIQVENVGDGVVSQTDLANLMSAITDVAGPLPDAAFVHAFGDRADMAIGDRVLRYLEPSRIAADTDARVVFYKEALGTGWDCPRAEVLFSFRRSVDPTTIAQTIGRMVRAPLARRIAEDDALNDCHVFLPHYDEAAVREVIGHLQRSGNDAIAQTIESRATSVTLPRRDGPDATEALEAIRRLPTYVVPTQPQRSAVRFLARLSRFLSSSGVDAAAKQREASAGADVLRTRYEALAEDAGFREEVDENGVIVITMAEALMGGTTLELGTTRRLLATAETIDREFGQARSRLSAEVANAYVERRRIDGASIRQAKLEARALAGRDAVVRGLEQWATDRIDGLRQQHGAAIDGLSAAMRSRYVEGVLQQAPNPTARDMDLPTSAGFRRGDNAFPKHLYGEPGVEPPIALGSNWERDTLDWELREHDVIAWLRNVERAPWALCIPRREGNGWRPFFPDFLVVRRDGNSMRVDIIDPHDNTRPDAVSKAKGLSDYARRHTERVGHVDLIAKVGTVYRRLHLDRESIRKQVDSLSDAGQKELTALFEREG